MKKELSKEEHLSKALDLMIDRAVDNGFGYDNIPEEYDLYKHDIEVGDMGYSEGIRYIVMKESFNL